MDANGVVFYKVNEGSAIGLSYSLLGFGVVSIYKGGYRKNHK